MLSEIFQCDQLQLSHQRVREGRTAAAGAGDAVRVAERAAGAYCFQLQRSHRRLRKGQLVAAGFGDAVRDAAPTVGA